MLFEQFGITLDIWYLTLHENFTVSSNKSISGASLLMRLGDTNYFPSQLKAAGIVRNVGYANGLGGTER